MNVTHSTQKLPFPIFFTLKMVPKPFWNYPKIEVLGNFSKTALRVFLIFTGPCNAFLFLFRMVDSMDICKSLNISIGIVMKNLEMLKFVHDHLKTEKKMCKHAVKKLPYLLRYVPDQ